VEKGERLLERGSDSIEGLDCGLVLVKVQYKYSTVIGYVSSNQSHAVVVIESSPRYCTKIKEITTVESAATPRPRQTERPWRTFQL
jgi:hypothetical protein